MMFKNGLHNAPTYKRYVYILVNCESVFAASWQLSGRIEL